MKGPIFCLLLLVALASLAAAAPSAEPMDASDRLPSESQMRILYSLKYSAISIDRTQKEILEELKKAAKK